MDSQVVAKLRRNEQVDKRPNFSVNDINNWDYGS